MQLEIKLPLYGSYYLAAQIKRIRVSDTLRNCITEFGYTFCIFMWYISVSIFCAVKHICKFMRASCRFGQNVANMY